MKQVKSTAISVSPWPWRLCGWLLWSGWWELPSARAYLPYDLSSQQPFYLWESVLCVECIPLPGIT